MHVMTPEGWHFLRGKKVSVLLKEFGSWEGYYVQRKKPCVFGQLTFDFLGLYNK